jgi:ActR/RegA family two-component response regulator/DNA-binding transcriptional ArsR family regulator
VRLLLVDDDAVFRQELSDLMEQDGHQVVAAPSVPKAVEALEHDVFDVIFTDLRMPRHSGLDLLREVRQRWPRTLVVVITGFATVETAIEAMKLGAFDYVRKPFQIDQVHQTLELARQEHEFSAPRGAFTDPEEMARTLATDADHPVLFFGERAPEGLAHVVFERLDPADPTQLVYRTSTFVAQYPGGAVVVAGAERLLDGHRLEDIAAILDRTRGELAGHGSLRVGFDPRKVSSAAAMALGGAVTSRETHETLEALANPIRRRILRRLLDGPASFSEAMKAAGLDDSPKMSFHMRKLVDGGLAVHEQEAYRLTERGKAASEIVREVTFLPPSESGANLAFPSRKSPRPKAAGAAGAAKKRSR